MPLILFYYFQSNIYLVKFFIKWLAQSILVIYDPHYKVFSYEKVEESASAIYFVKAKPFSNTS